LDIAWALDPERTDRLIKHRPLSHEEYTHGHSPSSILLQMVGALIAVAKGITGMTAQTKEAKAEIWEAIEKFEFNKDLAQKYVTGVKTLMLKQLELGIESREEVEDLMEAQHYDDSKVVLIMQHMASLQNRKSELGNPSRAEVKDMLLVAWEHPDREAMAATCLTTYRALVSDEGQMMSIFGTAPSASDKVFIRQSTYRFQGNKGEIEKYMKSVAELVHQGENLGNPSRDMVVATLDEFNLNAREAQRKLRDDYWKVKDAQLKEEYRRNRERAEEQKKKEEAEKA